VTTLGGRDAQTEALWSPARAPDGRSAVAVVIPCHNEEHAIASVVHDFRHALPEADVFVYDNRSTDATRDRATTAGAIVRREPRLGKGNVVRRMFADVDADIYVMVDGDGTYDAPTARRMVDMLVDDQLDMVVGRRERVADDDRAYRRGHSTGNAVFARVFRLLYGSDFTDAFSGYRVMSRRFVKSFPGTSSGFEIETELSAHAATVSALCAEVPTPYRSRNENSNSKLRTYRDGLRILGVSLQQVKELRPLQFFGILFLLLTAIALGFGIPVITEYAHSGLVPRFPTAILAAAIQTVAFICLTCGLVLQSVGRARQEVRRLAYLQIESPGGCRRRP
jgi:glycosyltransferase involved in cell wall biosynthesis